MQIFKMNFYVGFPRIKILAAPLSGPLRIFTHATPMVDGEFVSNFNNCKIAEALYIKRERVFEANSPTISLFIF